MTGLAGVWGQFRSKRGLTDPTQAARVATARDPVQDGAPPPPPGLKRDPPASLIPASDRRNQRVEVYRGGPVSSSPPACRQATLWWRSGKNAASTTKGGRL